MIMPPEVFKSLADETRARAILLRNRMPNHD